MALAAASLMLAGGCGVRVSVAPTPSGAPSATVASAAVSPSATPSAPASVSPSASATAPGGVTPSAAPSGAVPVSPAAPELVAPSGSGWPLPWEVVPAPAPRPASPTPPAVAAAARRLATARAVKAVLPSFDAAAQEMVARSGVPGAAVAVVAGDSAVYVRCFGVRETGRSEPVDLGTVFQLGTVSEGFTSAMLASLVSDHTLSWDAPARRYWPGFRLWEPWVSDHSTIRDLLACRSGLPAHAGNELLAFGYGRAEVLRRLRYLRPADGFRAAFAEQEALPTAAAVAAERVAGASWARLVRTRVLEPLGMTSTAVTAAAYDAAPDRATPHVSVGGVMQAQTPRSEDVLAPALGVSSSIGDLVQYVRMQLNGGAVDGARVAAADALAATQAATTPAGADDEGPVSAELGWDVSSYDGVTLVAKAGGVTRGSSALVSMSRADGVGIVVLANAYPEGHALTAALAATLYDLYIQGAPRQDWLAAGGPAPAAADASAAQAGGVLPEVLPEAPPADASAPRRRAAYAGVFSQRYYGRVTVSRGLGDTLRVRLGHGATIVYRPWDGDTWRDPVAGTAAVFTVVDGRATRVRLGLLAFGGRAALFAR
jgi:CubicO group peptidase (beta-lactamase class C family)